MRYAQAMARKYSPGFSVLDAVPSEYARTFEHGLGDQDQAKALKLYW